MSVADAPACGGKVGGRNAFVLGESGIAVGAQEDRAARREFTKVSGLIDSAVTACNKDTKESPIISKGQRAVHAYGYIRRYVVVVANIMNNVLRRVHCQLQVRDRQLARAPVILGKIR